MNFLIFEEKPFKNKQIYWIFRTPNFIYSKLTKSLKCCAIFGIKFLILTRINLYKSIFCLIFNI